LEYSHSVYAYVTNNPLIFTDPSGMSKAAFEGDGVNGSIADYNERIRKDDQAYWDWFDRTTVRAKGSISTPDYSNQRNAILWPPEKGTSGQIHTDEDGTFIHDGFGWKNIFTNSYILPTVDISKKREKSLMDYLDPFLVSPDVLLENTDKVGDYIDPFVGSSALYLSEKIKDRLLYHSFTRGEGFRKSLNRVSPLKTPFGKIKATTAFKWSTRLTGVGYGLNFISVASYTSDIIQGEVAKGVTGIGVVGLTCVVTTVCPPLGIVAIGASALYSLYLEDLIFKNNNNP
jgi:hypothetical protein